MVHQVSCFYTPKQTSTVEIEIIQDKLGLRMKLKTIKVFTKWSRKKIEIKLRIKLENKGLIDIIKTVKHERVCDSCQFKKLSRLTFFHSKQSSSDNFEKTHCDLLGLAPILSIEKFKYYAHLVDDSSKYTWIIPLQHMFDFSNAY